MFKKIWMLLFVIGILALPQMLCSDSPRLTHAVLADKIRGGWVGKAYGVSFGGPTEFKYQGTINENPLALNPEGLKRLPGQDDMYVNMALLKALVDHGLDATAADFAQEFAYGGFLLWHANGQGRQNILSGIPPEKSGHPLYNPHADDIDFQIECDFIGLVSPGLPQAAQKICDRAGHLMNYGDGMYGGYFVTAMYSAAFLMKDIKQIVRAGLDALPKESGYAAIIRDLMQWQEQYPADWKMVWKELEAKYNHDLCPWGAGRKFNIQARLNGAYIALGLLYGEGKLDKTVEISTRCGQDSDCNPANAGGIVGTMLGYEQLPEDIKTAMIPYMKENFDFTSYSIESATTECLRLAIANVEANGGKVTDDQIQISTQSFKAEGRVEISFPTLQPVSRLEVTDPQVQWLGEWQLFPKGDESMRRSSHPGDSMEFTFNGNAVYVQGDIRYDQGILECFIDGKSIGTRDMYLPKKWARADQSTAVWVTGLPDGEHKLLIKITGNKNADSEGIMVSLGKAVIYSGQIASEK
jgi:ADP-ribosylglycohydrolase